MLIILGIKATETGYKVKFHLQSETHTHTLALIYQSCVETWADLSARTMVRKDVIFKK